VTLCVYLYFKESAVNRSNRGVKGRLKSMEHYRKGRNEEEQLNSANIPLIGNIPQGHGWMLITGGTRLQTALGPACTLVKEEGTLVMAGVGSSIEKVEALASMVKKKMTGLFQVNKAGERIVREYWDPKSDDLVSILSIFIETIK